MTLHCCYHMQKYISMLKTIFNILNIYLVKLYHSKQTPIHTVQNKLLYNVSLKIRREEIHDIR